MTAKKPGSTRMKVAAADAPAVAAKTKSNGKRVVPPPKRAATPVAEAVSERPAAKRPASTSARAAKETKAAQMPRAADGGATMHAAAPGSESQVSRTGTPTAAPVEVPEATALAVPAPARSAISVDDIREAAFYLSQRRHGPSDPLADWLQAEQLLLTRAG